MSRTTAKLPRPVEIEPGYVLELEATAVEARAFLAERTLAALEAQEADAERHGDEVLASEIRRTAALVRDRRNGLDSQARELRAAAK